MRTCIIILYFLAFAVLISCRSIPVVRESEFGIKLLTSCEELSQEIIAESKSDPQWDEILAISDIREVDDSPYTLECFADTVEWSDPEYNTHNLRFYKEAELIGGYYIGYESEPDFAALETFIRSELDCEQLSQEIIAESKSAPRWDEILAISDIREVDDSPYTLECIADTVTWDDPEYNTHNLRFYKEAELDGSSYIGYESEPDFAAIQEELDKELEQWEKEMDEEIAKADAEFEKFMKELLQGEEVVESSSTPVPTSLREIMSEYQKNEARADLKYNEPFTLTANVSKIESHGLLLNAGSFMNHVEAYVADTNSLAMVDVGDKVALTCQGASGSFDSVGAIIRLERCSVAEK